MASELLCGVFGVYPSIVDLVGEDISDPDEAADAVFEAMSSDDTLKKEFQAWLSSSSVFNFVSSVNASTITVAQVLRIPHGCTGHELLYP